MCRWVCVLSQREREREGVGEGEMKEEAMRGQFVIRTKTNIYNNFKSLNLSLFH